MWETFSRIRRIAPHYRSVLVTGETGTGKELAARALHNLSPVAKGSFVVLNCSAVVETLFESELFGHVRGSFTGAMQDKAGLFEFADKGTIFLDEIGDMPIGTQAKLLRTLQNQEVLRVGSLTPRKVDVHVIAATHRDLRAAIAAKAFREDLYYRLSMIEVRLPTLVERKEDLPLLTKYFVQRHATQFRKDIRGLTQRAQVVLARHNWTCRISRSTCGFPCDLRRHRPRTRRLPLRAAKPSKRTRSGYWPRLWKKPGATSRRPRANYASGATPCGTKCASTVFFRGVPDGTGGFAQYRILFESALQGRGFCPAVGLPADARFAMNSMCFRARRHRNVWRHPTALASAAYSAGLEL
jgi:hypothetical protein